MMNRISSRPCKVLNEFTASRNRVRARLRLEMLEKRQLMAGDLMDSIQGSIANYRSEFDFDQNGSVQCFDALWVANRIATQSVAQDPSALDLDRTYSAEDFSNVVNFINQYDETENLDNGLAFVDQMQSEGFAADKTFESSFSLLAKGGGTPKTPFDYWRIGSPIDDDTETARSGGLAMVGGGTDVDEVFEWMGTKAMGKKDGGGDFLVIRATGTDAYNPYIDELVPGMNSVATLLIPDATAASDPRVAQIIRNAEAIFIAGGDQGDYAKFWNDTSVEDAIYDAMQDNNVPIGGTSAGLAVLGDFDFTAFTGKTIVSNDALMNPYNSAITIDGVGGDGFLAGREVPATYRTTLSLMNILDDTITDSHFRQRDRMGRLITFMARIDADGGRIAPGATVRGIGINEQTALLVEPDGMASVIGNPIPAGSTEVRSVYVMKHAVGETRPLTSPLTYT
ncbi:MAG: cyanophycinase, partial [Pirellula sp.]